MPPQTRAKKSSHPSDEESQPDIGDKRKVDDTDVKDEDKDPNTTDPETTNTRNPPKQPKKTADPVLNWLLSDDAFNLAYPAVDTGHGEIDWPAGAGRKTPPPADAGKHAAASSNDDNPASSETDDQNADILTYPSSPLTPFQNLVAALILSKPLSHRLGQRTINTLLNPPFGLRTPADLDEAGFEGRRQVMWHARTQHKEKTALQLGELAEGVREVNGGKGDGLEELSGLRKELEGLEVGESQGRVGEVLKREVKGVGETGVGIFLRRVQGQWEEVFPYADERALAGARRFGVVGEGQGAEELAEKLDGDREKLVRLLDVLVGLQLEKKLDEALEKAGVKE